MDRMKIYNDDMINRIILNVMHIISSRDNK